MDISWKRVSNREFRVAAEDAGGADTLKALGYHPRLREDKGRRTSEWMKELRSGE